jgi:hypothetical protein
LYRFKKAPRAWYGRIGNFVMSLGFTKSKEHSNLYFKVVDGDPMILLLYVDDLFLIGDEKLITTSKRNLFIEYQDEIPRHDALLLRSRGMEETE